jgi:SAM-dependent methyltransferase
VPFRAAFDCLWCGRRHVTGGLADLEGWAQLCPDCVGRAGDNEFLRFRVKRALAERARGSGWIRATWTPDDEDDWLRRRARFERGPIHDAAFAAELDAAGRWLDALPLSGRIVELGAGTGWWSPLLAVKGELTSYDPRPAALDRLRARLVAHRLRAHLHPRDLLDPPEGSQADAVVAPFVVGGLPVVARAAFIDVARRWLRPGGILATIDAQGDEPGAIEPDDLGRSLRGAGLDRVDVGSTGRFLVLASATAG